MSNRVTDAEAKQMQERCDKATPGEWTVNDHSEDESCLYVESPDSGICSVFTDAGGNDLHNSAFIAHARTDMPRLLSERERLLAIVRGLASEVDNTDSMHVNILIRLATEYMAEVTK